MPIEVRQLVIRSTVESGREAAFEERRLLEILEQLRREIVTECEVVIEEKLQQLRER